MDEEREKEKKRRLNGGGGGKREGAQPHDPPPGLALALGPSPSPPPSSALSNLPSAPPSSPTAAASPAGGEEGGVPPPSNGSLANGDHPDAAGAGDGDGADEVSVAWSEVGWGGVACSLFSCSLAVGVFDVCRAGGRYLVVFFVTGRVGVGLVRLGWDGPDSIPSRLWVLPTCRASTTQEKRGVAGSWGRSSFFLLLSLLVSQTFGGCCRDRDRPHSGVVVVARFAGRIVSVVSESLLQPPSSLSLACCRHRRLGGNLTYVSRLPDTCCTCSLHFFFFFFVVLWTNQGRDLAGVAKTEQNLSNARIPARASRERQTPRLYVTTSSRMAFCLRARSLRHAALTTTFGRSSFASLFLSRCLSPHHVAVAVPALFLLYLYSIMLSCFRD